MSSKSVAEIAFDALREIYQEAEPPLDFNHALENPEKYGDGWYLEHTLDSERQKEIVERHCDKHDVNRREHAQITFTAITHYGPRSESVDIDD